MTRHTLLLSLGLVLAMPASAHAAGFALADQGGASSALAGAATARGDLPEAGYTNPAGYILHPGFRANLGLSLLGPRITHTSGDGTDTSTTSGPTPIPRAHAAFASKFVGAGVSVFAPYASSVPWPAGWAGRYASQSSRLQVIEAAPHVMVRPLPFLGIAASARMHFGSLSLSRSIDFVAQDGAIDLDASGVGIGWQLAALARITDPLYVGAVFRSGTTIDMAGTADARDVPVEFSDRARDTRFTTTIRTPWRASVGGSYRFADMTVSADAEVSGWQRFDAIAIDFEDPAVADLSDPRDWQTSYALKLGYEYVIPGDQFRARAGFAWDPSPAPLETLSPSSPDSDRIIAALGAGWRAPFGLEVNLGLSATRLAPRTSQIVEGFPGSYRGRILAGTVDVSWSPAKR